VPGGWAASGTTGADLFDAAEVAVAFFALTVTVYTMPLHKPPTSACVFDAAAVTVLAGHEAGEPDAGVAVTVKPRTPLPDGGGAQSASRPRPVPTTEVSSGAAGAVVATASAANH